MVEIDRKKEKRIKSLLKIRNILSKDWMFWGVVLIYYIILTAGLTYALVWMPENWLTKFMDENMVLSMIIYFSLAFIIIPIYFKVLGKINDEDKAFCEYISAIEGVTADEMMEIAEKYKLENMFQLALEKRLKELRITKVPPCCMDRWQVVRLPTRDDLNGNW